MKNVDYIVVGLGIAGISFCEQLEQRNLSYIAIDKAENGATFKSGGVLNPTILKRFTAAWNASEFYPVAVDFFKDISKKLNYEVFLETPIYRILNNTEEQNNWVVASEKVGLRNFLQTELVKNPNPEIIAPYGLGRVLGAARIQKDDFLSLYKSYLHSTDRIIDEDFEYDQLFVEDKKMIYKDTTAGRIVFCDGPGALQNKFFPQHAIIPNKGEYLVVHIPNLKLEGLLKGPIYLIPIGNDLYKAGATYNREDATVATTESAREEIETKLQRIISCPYEVVGQTAGVRPTTRDRKPLLGSLDKNLNVVFFNGLGTHGFLMAPYLAKLLCDNLELGTAIPSEMDIKRVL